MGLLDRLSHLKCATYGANIVIIYYYDFMNSLYAGHKILIEKKHITSPFSKIILVKKTPPERARKNPFMCFDFF